MVVDEKKTPRAVRSEAATAGGASTTDKARREKCKAILEHERAWVLANPGVFERIMAWAENNVKNGQAFAMQTAVERARWFDVVDKAGQPVRVSNDFASIWSRRLIARVPAAARFVRTRPSAFDELDWQAENAELEHMMNKRPA